MQIRTFMIKTHRLLGAVMSVFFVAWFLSGIVLIYKPYPKYTQDEALAHSARIPEALPSTDSLAAVLRARGLDTLQLSSLSLQGGSYADSRARLVLQPEEGERVELAFDGDSLRSLVLDRAYLEDIASRWGQRIERIDTIQELDQWVPFGRLTSELPFYRLLLTGGAGHEVYVSSLTGRVLQESTRVERAWAWAGAIPHWIYFTWIRSQQELWRWVIIVLGALGTMMAVTGFYIGISYYRMRGRRKGSKLYSPFTKKRYQWHHAFGTVGGLLTITWVLTGLLSVVHYPHTETEDYPVERLEGAPLRLEAYRTDLEALRQAEPELRRLSFYSWGDIPLLQAEGGEEVHYYDARSEQPRRLELTEAEITGELQKVFGAEHQYRRDFLQEYDSYYIDRTRRLPLPVWRIAIDTREHHSYYVSPERGRGRLIADNERIDAWMFSKLHRLQFAKLVAQPWLWTVVMWGFLLIGTITSVTGLWMTGDYLKRLWRKRRRRP